MEPWSDLKERKFYSYPLTHKFFASGSRFYPIKTVPSEITADIAKVQSNCKIKSFVLGLNLANFAKKDLRSDFLLMSASKSSRQAGISLKSEMQRFLTMPKGENAYNFTAINPPLPVSNQFTMPIHEFLANLAVSWIRKTYKNGRVNWKWTGKNGKTCGETKVALREFGVFRESFLNQARHDIAPRIEYYIPALTMIAVVRS